MITLRNWTGRSLERRLMPPHEASIANRDEHGKHQAQACADDSRTDCEKAGTGWREGRRPQREWAD